jgi:hypothetical protein
MWSIKVEANKNFETIVYSNRIQIVNIQMATNKLFKSKLARVNIPREINAKHSRSGRY